MNDEKDTQVKQICRIEIMFPVTSDEHALKIRRDISEALKDIEKKQFRFSIIEG